MHARKQILVLDGPSALGKTAYLRSLFLPGTILEMNCAAMKSIHLTGFDAETSKCIFWDELSAHMILQNRKFFEHHTAWLDLGHSPTGVHVKSFWLNGCVSAVASNCFMGEMEACELDESSWLKANCVIVKVDRPLFHDDCGPTRLPTARVKRFLWDSLPPE